MRFSKTEQIGTAFYQAAVATWRDLIEIEDIRSALPTPALLMQLNRHILAESQLQGWMILQSSQSHKKTAEQVLGAALGASAATMARGMGMDPEQTMRTLYQDALSLRTIAVDEHRARPGLHAHWKATLRWYASRDPLLSEAVHGNSKAELLLQSIAVDLRARITPLIR